MHAIFASQDFITPARESVNAAVSETPTRPQLQADQFSARQNVNPFAVPESVFEVATRDAGVLAGYRFGARSFTMRDGVDEGDVLVGGDQKQFAKVV